MPGGTGGHSPRTRFFVAFFESFKTFAAPVSGARSGFFQAPAQQLNGVLIVSRVIEYGAEIVGGEVLFHNSGDANRGAICSRSYPMSEARFGKLSG